MNNVIKTDRLVLRPLQDGDAADIARLIGDWDVIRWLTNPPWPYGLADAAWFVGDRSSRASRAITINGKFAGIIGFSDELGYSLGREFWGQGIMSEAANAVVASYIATNSATLGARYLLGNQASSNVLGKLEFRPTEVGTSYSKPLGRDIECQIVTLTKDRWSQARG